MLNVPVFGEVMTAIYITFLDPDELDACLSALSPRTWLARLGWRVPALAFWRGVGRPAAFPAWQQRQREFPFEGGHAQHAREPMTAG